MSLLLNHFAPLNYGQERSPKIHTIDKVTKLSYAATGKVKFHTYARRNACNMYLPYTKAAQLLPLILVLHFP